MPVHWRASGLYELLEFLQVPENSVECIETKVLSGMLCCKQQSVRRDPPRALKVCSCRTSQCPRSFFLSITPKKRCKYYLAISCRDGFLIHQQSALAMAIVTQEHQRPDATHGDQHCRRDNLDLRPSSLLTSDDHGAASHSRGPLEGSTDPLGGSASFSGILGILSFLAVWL